MKVFIATFDGSEKPEDHPDTVRAFCASVRMRMYSLELWIPFSRIPMEVKYYECRCVVSFTCCELTDKKKNQRQ